MSELPIDEALTASMRSSVWPETEPHRLVGRFPGSDPEDMGGMTAEDLVRLAERELREDGQP